ncbi:MAG TPA: PEP-CTERM sorting domain-containing protein [Pyrinomonadaceae bacterium]|nr:PEP-CTERM sorting domain-containing protein [Pyrinomonadaceae bacterium]
MRQIFTFLKPVALGFALCAIFALTQGTARADEVTISGHTNGCFGTGCSPTNTSAQQTDTIIGLTYNNSTFSGTTSGGFLGIGNTGQPPGMQNVNNLGSFTLDGGATGSYDGESFTLLVTFTAPPNVTGGPNTFQALLTGSVSATRNGGVFIDFDNTPRLFTFSFMNGEQLVTGSFLFAVNDASVIADGTIALSGQITQATQATPEPTTILLISTGLVGVAGSIRRRRRAQQQHS